MRLTLLLLALLLIVAASASPPARGAEAATPVTLPSAGEQAVQGPRITSHEHVFITFASALMQAAEAGKKPLLAEVGTWKARWPAYPYTTNPKTPREASDAVVKGAGYKISQVAGWHLAQPNKWYMFPSYDCDLDLLRQIDNDGGLTPETALQVLGLSPRHAKTLETWLARQQPDGGGRARCPEVGDLLDDPQCKAGLLVWASLTPRQGDAALSVGLGFSELQPPQSEMIRAVLQEAGWPGPTEDLAAGLIIHLRLPGPQALDYDPTRAAPWETPPALRTALEVNLPAPARAAPPVADPGFARFAEFMGREVALLKSLGIGPSGHRESETVRVELPAVGPDLLAARRKRQSLLDALQIGKIKSYWPKEEDRSGLNTPFTLWCKVVKVKEVLLSITHECGVHLQADSWAANRYLLANFEGKTVKEFQAALAALLRCEWRWDAKGEYWLLYQPDAMREEEKGLIAQYEAEEAVKRADALTTPRAMESKELAKGILDAIDAPTAERIRRGAHLALPLSELPEHVRLEVVNAYLGRSRTIVNGKPELWSIEHLVWAAVEFVPYRGGTPGSTMNFIGRFQKQDGMGAMGGRSSGGRSSLGPAF